MNDLFELRGRTALVTGGAGGLGAAIVEALAAQGATVVLSDRGEEEGGRCAAGLRARGLDVRAIAADMGHAASIDALVDRTLAEVGHVDILVCNAGIPGPVGPIGEVDDAAFQSVVDINLRAPMRLAARLVPAMARRGGGRVVLMASIAGVRGNRAIGAYGLTKAALAQLARNLAVEWGPSGVTANAVSPGLIRTPFSTGLMADEAFMARRLAQTPLRRVGEPREIAGVVVMLAGAAGGFITGQNLVVDGGTTIGDGS